MKIWLSLVIAFLFLICLYWTRYQIVTTIDQTSLPSFYKINRFTGDIELVIHDRTSKVMDAEETRRVREAAVPAPAPDRGPIDLLKGKMKYLGKEMPLER